MPSLPLHEGPQTPSRKLGTIFGAINLVAIINTII